MWKDFLAFYKHLNEVIGHYEDCISASHKHVSVVKEAFKVVKRKLFDFLEYLYVQRVLLRAFVVGQKCSTNSIIFVECTLLDDWVLLSSNFVYNRNMLLSNSKVKMIPN